MQKFVIPTTRKALGDFILGIHHESTPLEGAHEGATPISFIYFLDKLSDYRDLLPNKEMDIPEEMITKLDKSAQILSGQFDEDNLHMFSLALDKEACTLEWRKEKVAAFREAIREFDHFEEFFTALRASAILISKGYQHLHEDPEHTAKMIASIRAAAMEASNEEVILRKRDNPDFPTDAASMRSSIKDIDIDMTKVVAGSGILVREYEDLIAQTQNAKLLMQGIVEGVDKIVQNDEAQGARREGKRGPSGGEQGKH